PGRRSGTAKPAESISSSPSDVIVQYRVRCWHGGAAGTTSTRPARGSPSAPYRVKVGLVHTSEADRTPRTPGTEWDSYHNVAPQRRITTESRTHERVDCHGAVSHASRRCIQSAEQGRSARCGQYGRPRGCRP